MGFSFRLTARVLLYAPSHRKDSIYHSICYMCRGPLAGTRNSSMGPPNEGSIRRPIALRNWNEGNVLFNDTTILFMVIWLYGYMNVWQRTAQASLEINIFGVPDTMSHTNKCVPDIQKSVTNLYWTMTMTRCLFQGLLRLQERKPTGATWATFQIRSKAGFFICTIPQTG